MPHATIAPDLIEVFPSFREDMQPCGHYLTVRVSDGWNDVKKICKKVLQYEGRNYTFTGWNSDTNNCYFREATSLAKIKRK